MTHILKYRLKVMLRNRTMVFWSLFFPIALMTLFGLVLRSSFSYTEFNTVPIAIVNNDAWQENETLHTVLDEAKNNNRALFKVQSVSEQDAKQLLQDEKVVAYVVCGNKFNIHVASSGINQTITQTFFDEYLQKSSMVEDLVKRGASMEQIQALFTQTKDYVMENGAEQTDMTNVYFYTALAMSALFGGRWAINAIGDIQADQSQKGARISLAPVNKATHLFISLFLNLVSVFGILCIQFAYIYLLFDINFKDQLPSMFLLLLVGDIAGSGLGSLIGTVFQTRNPDEKINILSSITMFCSFLSGMMIVNLKWIIQHYIPILHYINPASLITDGMYSLYYYGVGERFYINIIALIIFSILCYVISFFTLSKKQYTSLGVR